MTTTDTNAPTMRRELGSWDLGVAGPTLFVVAGIHGNEKSGVLAAQRVLGRLQENEWSLRGRIVALAGNLQALSRDRRFVDRDLNRKWTSAQVADLLARDPALDSGEDKEQRELLEWFERVEKTASGPLVFVDLHSSSAGGPPFVCMADTIDNRRVAMATGVPLILGIEETIEGASLEYWSARGVVNFAVEGGRHEDDSTVDNHEAVLWILLEELGMLDRSVADTARARAQIEQSRKDAPTVVEIIERRAITPDDAFVMEPGFLNFQRIAKGELLARDRNGEIRSPSSCRVMLPLYQTQGEDGFFRARDVRPFWLRVASWMRRLRLDAIVHWLPGVRRDPADPNTILVNPRVARWFVTECFHLLGFRGERRRGKVLTFSRRVSRPENRRLLRGKP